MSPYTLVLTLLAAVLVVCKLLKKKILTCFRMWSSKLFPRSSTYLIANNAILVQAVTGAGSSPTKKCPSNEAYSWCGKRCEPSCKVPSPNEETCPELVSFTKTPVPQYFQAFATLIRTIPVTPFQECNPLKAACRCKQGFFRNAQRKCVKLEKCPK